MTLCDLIIPMTFQASFNPYSIWLYSISFYNVFWSYIIEIFNSILYFKQWFHSIFTQESACAYTILLMAIYWVTEVVPLAVTALLPLVLYPLLGVLPAKTVSEMQIQSPGLHNHFIKICVFVDIRIFNSNIPALCWRDTPAENVNINKTSICRWAYNT